MLQKSDGWDGSAAHLTITKGDISDSQGEGYVGFYQPPYNSQTPFFKIAKNSVYTLSFWAKVDNQRMIKVIAKDGNEKLTDELPVELKINVDGQYYSVELRGNKDSTNGRLLFECVIRTNEVIGNIWFDDIQFYESSACK